MSTVCQWFGLKTTGTIFFGLTSKPVATVSPGLASKPVVEGFPVWASKSTATVSWFGLQNQANFGLSVAPQNQQEDATTWDTHRDLVAYFTWKQVGLEFHSLG
jgi:hypothetical protein